MTIRRRRTLAIDALEELIDTGLADTDWVARQLAVRRRVIQAWLANEQPMPVERQLLLATLLIERVPQLARLGYRLHGHVRATLLYRARETKTHLTAPVSRFRPPSRANDQRPPG